ncbi:MAG TPA: serpin family protein, partial [Longimicrobiales bacterium]|nr:serpin family protein [Longimicrobiales bacterium]
MIRYVRVALLAGILAGCGDGPLFSDPDYRPEGTARALTSQERAVLAANTEFGLELLRHVAGSTPGNVLVSPLSVSMALGMAMNGAAGETWNEMRTTLGFAGLSPQQINEAYGEVIDQVRLRDVRVTLGIANSIWHDQSFELLPLFVEQAETYFDARVSALDFSDPDAPVTINDWVKRATGGRIPELIDQIAPDEVAFLVNAVYFKAAWSTSFDPRLTRIGSFHRADGGTTSAQFMTREDELAHVADGSVLAVELPYQDSAFTMVLVMPQTGSIDDYLGTLTPARWDALLARLATANAQLSMPKFTFTMETDLSDVLKAMGMPSAFDDQLADFTLLTPTPAGLYLSRVQHNTFIKVDEIGTEAAAATGVGVGVTSLPPQLTFDRPFLAAIRERETGAVLFVGGVREPSGGAERRPWARDRDRDRDR